MLAPHVYFLIQIARRQPIYYSRLSCLSLLAFITEIKACGDQKIQGNIKK
jgi:hypothetical protein